jgi:hypothetical protein
MHCSSDGHGASFPSVHGNARPYSSHTCPPSPSEDSSHTLSLSAFKQGEGAEYLGEEVYKDVPCEVWDKVDPLSGDEHKVWWAKSDGRPVKMFTSGGPNDISQKDYVAYEPKPIDASYFDIPDYCTSAGTRVMEPEELHAVVRERHLFF